MLLLALGILLILITIVLLILWRQAAQTIQAIPSINDVVCTGTDNDNLPCKSPYYVVLALPAKYAHAALATGAVGVGCLIGAYLLGRRTQTKR